MSDTFRRVVELIRDGDVLISAHGYDEMAEDGILARDAIDPCGLGHPARTGVAGCADHGLPS